MASNTAITVEEFESLPFALSHDAELVDGELVKVSGNTGLHNRLRDLLVVLLTPFVEKQGLGQIVSEQEFDFDDNVHGPYVVLIGADRLDRFDLSKRVQRFAPTFAIEIVSNNDKFGALMTKAARYRRCGTSEVWVISPETRQAFVQSDDRHLILEESGRLETPLIPGFSIGVGELIDRVTRPYR
jgi:Uma2 family endonuclease